MLSADCSNVGKRRVYAIECSPPRLVEEDGPAQRRHRLHLPQKAGQPRQVLAADDPVRDDTMSQGPHAKRGSRLSPLSAWPVSQNTAEV